MLQAQEVPGEFEVVPAVEVIVRAQLPVGFFVAGEHSAQDSKGGSGIVAAVEAFGQSVDIIHLMSSLKWGGGRGTMTVTPTGVVLGFISKCFGRRVGYGAFFMRWGEALRAFVS